VPDTAPFPRLDAGLRLPLYHQLVMILRERILSGAVRPGDLLPGEPGLAATFGVSRITAKRALNELAADGLVRRERGRGTVVLDHPAHPAQLAAIDGWQDSARHMARVTRVSVLEFGYVPVPPGEAAALDIAPGTAVQRAVRVRHAEAGPMSHLVTHVPAEIGRRFDAADLARQSLQSLLERAGVQVAEARQTVSATLADAEVASALAVPAGTALIEVRRVLRVASGRAVECLRALYRPDIHRIVMTMRHEPGRRAAVWSAAEPGAEDRG
jgi:GntR family transcriptional regulator